MLMKVHNKGQVVIPAEMREQLGISVGDLLEVDVDVAGHRIELRKHQETSRTLAGSLQQYNRGKAFPSREEMHRSLQAGLSHNG
jgi:AbrB family looped-hinge helix DNA binding protein